jgi:hypothetical protein
MKRALSVDNVLNAKFNGLQFEGKWKLVIGTPPRAHSWAIWGQSASGKTTFNFQLAKYISQFERVLYNSLEEGLSMSIQAAYKRANITKTDKVQLVSESMKDLEKRLLKPKSANVVFIDSTKYIRFRWADYERFCEMFPNKILIWVMHAKGSEPKGALAEDIRYDSFVKIYVEGFRAFISSRFTENGDGHIDVWPEGAKIYYAEIE